MAKAGGAARFVLATAAAAHDPPGTLRVLGERITVKVPGKEAWRTAAVIEETTAPGKGPPLHVHGREDELFYVVAGRLRIWRSEQTFVVGPGVAVYLQRNVPHTFRNVGTRPSRVLVTIIPGGFEGFFEEVDRQRLQIPADAAKIEELAARFGLKLLGPPPATKPPG